MAVERFDDLVPRWMFAIRSAWGRAAVATLVPALCAVGLIVADDPTSIRPGPVLVVPLVAVAAVAGWQATGVAGVLIAGLYWWYGIPHEDSFRLERGLDVVAVVGMAILVVGLTWLTRRVQRAVDEVRELDARRREFADLQVLSRAAAEQGAADVGAALRLSTELAALQSMREVARHVLEHIEIPTPAVIGSIAVLDGGRLRVIGARNADPASLRALEQIDLASSSWLGEVLTGVPALVDDRDEFARLHPTARTLRIYPRGSWATIPFRSHETVGLLSLYWSEPQQLTARAQYFSLVAEILANALDRTDAEEQRRAHLQQLEQAFAERDRIARTLSTTLLPPKLPALPGFSAAGWVIPGTTDQVAGDFYDLFSVASGDWFAVLGDVCGKGAEAAAVTSLARYATRVAALDDPDPRHAASVANRALMDDPSDLFCTMAAVRFRAATEEVEVTLCGHQQVRHVSEGRLVRLGTFAPALGLSDRDPLVQAHPFRPGEVIVLFSDGLVERSASFDDAKLDALLESMAWMSADAIAVAIRQQMAEIVPERTDDMSLLVIVRDRA